MSCMILIRRLLLIRGYGRGVYSVRVHAVCYLCDCSMPHTLYTRAMRLIILCSYPAEMARFPVDVVVRYGDMEIHQTKAERDSEDWSSS